MIETISAMLSEDILKIFKSLYNFFDVRVCFTSPTHEIINAVQNRPSDYCYLLRTKLFSQQLCWDFDKAKQKEATEQKHMIHYQCHAGLLEIVYPIYMGDNLLGYILIGQIRTTKKIKDDIEKAWIEKIGPLYELQEAFDKLPYISEEKLADFLDIIRIIIEYIIMQKMITAKGNIIVQRILNYIQENINKNISINDLARLTGKSYSTVSHLFKNVIGTSVKEYTIDAKLRMAEQYFTETPDISIKEIASRLSFNSTVYFSRIFKKYRGKNPRRYFKDLTKHSEEFYKKNYSKKE
ncbi:PocR ligand-binding domain-containing protein [Spirochaetota bacterium]